MIGLLKHLCYLSLILGSCKNSSPKDQFAGTLVPLKYNHPGLTVDLGVGLWAWPLPMDFDGDGDMDLVVSCPDKPYNGLYFFENATGSHPNEVVFEPAVKIGPGEKNLQISMVNGAPRVLGRGLEYRNFKDAILSDPVEIFPKDQIEREFGKIRFSQWKYVDYENDGDYDILVGIDDWDDYGWDNAFDSLGNWTNGPLHGYVILLENQQGSYQHRGKLMADGKPIDVYGAPTPNMMDFDNDGDLDLICGEFLDRFSWFENVGSREQPVFAAGRFLLNQQDTLKMDLEMIIPVGTDMDQDGDIDLVVGDEDGRVAWLEHTGLVENHMPVFEAPKYFLQKADWVKFGALVTPYAVDWDDDGDEDLICGNTAGYIGFIENLDGGDPPKWAEPVYLKSEGKVIRITAGDHGSIQGPAEKKWGYTTLSVADWDGDQLHDIIVNSIWGKVIWFKNVGSKGAPVLAKGKPVLVEGESLKPSWNWWDPKPNHLVTQWRTTPVAVDWNADELMDLVMVDYQGYMSYFERYKEAGELYLMPGKRIFYGTNASAFDNGDIVMDSTEGLLQLNNETAGSSGRRKLCLVDIDADRDLDLLVNSSNVSLLLNGGSQDGKVMFEYKGPLYQKTLAGHTTSPSMVNWSSSSPKLLIGAEDGHFYYAP